MAPARFAANGLYLDNRPERLGWLNPSAADMPMASLRSLYAQQGYVWLKQALPRADVLAFRGLVFSRLSDAGLLAAGSDPAEGRYSGTIGGSLAQKRLMELVRSAAFEAFCLHPALWPLMEVFVEGTAYLHKRKIMRYTLPGSDTATPAHYDLVYLRGGTDRIVTVWIPIGDTPAAMGGLTYLEGSHRLGMDMERDFAARNAELTPNERISAFNRNMTEGGWVSKDLPDMAERFDTRWLVADYEAGDIVLHSPYMIHASTTNVDPENRIRLSTDIRYQNVRDEIDARWGDHWSLGDML